MGSRAWPDPVASGWASSVAAAPEDVPSGAASAPPPSRGYTPGRKDAGLGASARRERDLPSAGTAAVFSAVFAVGFLALLLVRLAKVAGATLAARLGTSLASPLWDFLVLRALTAGLAPVPGSGWVVLGPILAVPATTLGLWLSVVASHDGGAEVSPASAAHSTSAATTGSGGGCVGAAVAAPTAKVLAASSTTGSASFGWDSVLMSRSLEGAIPFLPGGRAR